LILPTNIIVNDNFKIISSPTGEYVGLQHDAG